MEKNCENKYVMHIVSLVFGIISIVIFLYWYISLPTGIIAIVLGAKSFRRTGNKIAKAGIITGIVGFSLSALYCIVVLLIIMLIVKTM